MPSNDSLVILVVRIYHTTDSAILIGEPGLKKTDSNCMEWIPLSMVNHSKEIPGNKVELEIPRWMMAKKELEYLEKTD